MAKLPVEEQQEEKRAFNSETMLKGLMAVMKRNLSAVENLTNKIDEFIKSNSSVEGSEVVENAVQEVKDTVNDVKDELEGAEKPSV